jgi:hypothetical protein
VGAVIAACPRGRRQIAVEAAEAGQAEVAVGAVVEAAGGAGEGAGAGIQVVVVAEDIVGRNTTG